MTNKESLRSVFLLVRRFSHISEARGIPTSIFEVAVYHHWGNDPYAGGVGALLEHCSKFEARWIQGAIKSAIDAVQGVHAAR